MAAVAGAAWAERAAPRQIDIEYVPPKNAVHAPLYEALKGRHALEKLQTFLSPLRLPRRLMVKLEGCDGESNAWYEDGAVTVCYEYLHDSVSAAQKRSRPETLSEQDVIVGAFNDVFLHEVAHAAFDYLDIPILGREEDAADQVAAYVMLKMGREEAVRLVSAVVYLYANEVGANTARRLKKLKVTSPAAAFSDVHSTPAQRLYNIMCVAYGADPKAFAMAVEGGALPSDRAEGCAEEYQQIAKAYDRLIRPHLDPELAKAVMQQQWLPPPKQ